MFLTSYWSTRIGLLDLDKHNSGVVVSGTYLNFDEKNPNQFEAISQNPSLNHPKFPLFMSCH